MHFRQRLRFNLHNFIIGTIKSTIRACNWLRNQCYCVSLVGFRQFSPVLACCQTLGFPTRLGLKLRIRLNPNQFITNRNQMGLPNRYLRSSRYRLSNLIQTPIRNWLLNFSARITWNVLDHHWIPKCYWSSITISDSNRRNLRFYCQSQKLRRIRLGN